MLRLHVAILLEWCIMQQLSVANSSLHLCSEIQISERKNEKMKAGPLTPLGRETGNSEKTRVAEQIHICHQPGGGERQIWIKSH